ncbi:MAG: hypothetical protein CL678_06540 [Bdellovibrionaceae bacterium]|nr:hypothetical protein [Pseudobdellovibrionaceae bacterium]|tara:strand:+ start:1757 stop:2338 length:582 start_codon:yes stop_codon:yes gene_type:complete
MNTLFSFLFFLSTTPSFAQLMDWKLELEYNQTPCESNSFSYVLPIGSVIHNTETTAFESEEFEIVLLGNHEIWIRDRASKENSFLLGKWEYESQTCEPESSIQLLWRRGYSIVVHEVYEGECTKKESKWMNLTYFERAVEVDLIISESDTDYTFKGSNLVFRRYKTKIGCEISARTLKTKKIWLKRKASIRLK